MPYVERAVVSAAVEHLSAYYLIHAGVVASEDRGVILPAASGRGKSSLVARLVAGGWYYLSDEVAVITPESGKLLPFAKSLHIHGSARKELAASYPSLLSSAPYRTLDDEEIWYLPPQPGWLPRQPIPLRFAIVPSFSSGARTELLPVPPSTVLASLWEQSFNLRKHGTKAIGNLVQLLRDVRCYTLTFGNLDDAAGLLQRLMATDN